MNAVFSWTFQILPCFVTILSDMFMLFDTISAKTAPSVVSLFTIFLVASVNGEVYS